MKLNGFTLHGIYLDTDSESFDLHNCFDFAGLDYDISSRSLQLRWTPSSYAPPSERRTILLTFRQVTHFSAQPRDPTMPFTEDNCLSDVCFVAPNAPTDDGVSTDTLPAPDLLCVFTLMSGFSFGVHAENAHCKIQ